MLASCWPLVHQDHGTSTYIGEDTIEDDELSENNPVMVDEVKSLL